MSDANLAGQNGIVFNIQRYSVHDGAGIRTVVFLKGCPLRCRWCSNPESQERAPELAYNKKKCLGRTLCGSCQAVCPHGALTDGENDKIACRRAHFAVRLLFVFLDIKKKTSKKMSFSFVFFV